MGATVKPWVGCLLVLGACSAGGVPPVGSPPRRETAAAPATPFRDRAAALVGMALEHGQAFAILSSLCTTAPHRLAGSAGAAQAVAWGRQQMQRLGLQNVRLEKCMVPRWVRGPVARLRVAPSGREFAITALGNSVGTPAGGIRGRVLMVRSFEQLRTLGEQARGRIVFLNRPMNPRLLNTFSAYGGAVDQRSSGPVVTAEVGGIATLVRSMTTRLDDNPHTGATGYRNGVPRVPAAAISTKGAEALAALLEAQPDLELELELSCRHEPDVESANVVGDLPGTARPDEIVLIGGHLDCWDIGQGAHDDGAGIAHCLAAVDLLRRCRIAPRRTIRVVLFMNEENGVRGAKAYVREHAAELSKHVAALESDRGGLLPRGFTSSARGARLERLRAMVDPLREFDMGVVLAGGGGVDISFLQPSGTEMFGLLPSSQRYFDYHHSALDCLDAVNPRELELGAAAVAYLASVLADEDR